MLYQLKRELILKTSLEKAWDFFSHPSNLAKITPAKLNFKITSEIPKRVYPGLIITYKVHPLFSIPCTWVSEITHLREPFYFVDEQRHGPYKMWHHQHRFSEQAEGVLVEDIVNYIMPFHIFGCMTHKLWVKKELDYIFDYREKALNTHFNKTTNNDKQ